MRQAWNILRFGWVFGAVLFASQARAQYTVNGNQTYQLIDGFGANLNHRSWNGDELKPVLDQMIDQAGMTVFRVAFDNTDWMTISNETPAQFNSVYNSARFEKLWDLITYLNNKGISNGIMLNFEGPGPAWMGGTTLNSGYEAQWAQMISSLIIYARNTRHLNFYLVGPDNEPDNAGDYTGVGVGASQYVTMLDLLAQDLNSNGLSDIRFVGPDLATTSTSPWMQAMLNDSTLMGKLAHFGLHSYSTGGGQSAGIAGFLNTSGYPNSTFWMTEYNAACTTCFNGVLSTNNYGWSFSSTAAQNLINHLDNGATACVLWEGYDSVYELLPLAYLQSGYQAAGWSFYGMFGVNDTNAVPKIYTPRQNFYTVSQVSAFVPPGSRRIGVSGSTNSSFMMLAFYHTNSGRVTLSGFNTGSSTSFNVTLQSLPAVASFDLYYTDPNTNLSHSATYAVSGNTFTPTIPADCIFTLTGFDPAKIAVSVQITNPASGTYYSAPAAISLQAAATTASGSISNVDFYANGVDIGGDSNAPYGILWTNVGPGKYTVTAVATNSTGNTNVSAPVCIAVAGPPAQIVVAATNTLLFAPTNATVIPHAQQQFAASVVDALGTPLAPQPAVAWSTDGGGTVDFNGWFTAGSGVGGPFNIAATNNGVSGSTSVTIIRNLNLAQNGIGYVWYNLPNNTSSAQQYESPGLTDGDLSNTVSLLPCCEGSSDFANDYEAAGVVWSIAQTISSVVYINGAVSNGNGSFDSGFQLQFSQDGNTWAPAGSQWTLSPAYNYNSSAASLVAYTFSGGLDSVLGVRCVGKVNAGQNTSGVAYAAEVQAYLGAPPALQAMAGPNDVVVMWTYPVTNCVLETTTNDVVPWTTVTNAWQTNGGQISVTIPARYEVQYFRLRFL